MASTADKPRTQLRDSRQPVTFLFEHLSFLASSFAYFMPDDFGTDGDDTLHSKIPNYPQPNDIQSKASFPADGSDPKTVDFIFLDFIANNYVIPALQSLGAKYTVEDIREYLPVTFTTNSYLPLYAKLAWQKGVPNCPVGIGVGA